MDLSALEASLEALDKVLKYGRTFPKPRGSGTHKRANPTYIPEDVEGKYSPNVKYLQKSPTPPPEPDYAGRGDITIPDPKKKFLTTPETDTGILRHPDEYKWSGNNGA